MKILIVRSNGRIQAELKLSEVASGVLYREYMSHRDGILPVDDYGFKANIPYTSGALEK